MTFVTGFGKPTMDAQKLKTLLLLNVIATPKYCPYTVTILLHINKQVCFYRQLFASPVKPWRTKQLSWSATSSFVWFLANGQHYNQPWWGQCRDYQDTFIENNYIPMKVKTIIGGWGSSFHFLHLCSIPQNFWDRKFCIWRNLKLICNKTFADYHNL